MSRDGLCRIKPQYVLPETKREIQLVCVSDRDRNQLDHPHDNKEAAYKSEETIQQKCTVNVDNDASIKQCNEGKTGSEKGGEKSEEPPHKKKKFEKKLKGQNKNRGPTYNPRNDQSELCIDLISLCEGDEIKSCSRDGCKLEHDVEAYLKNKKKDLGPECYNFRTFGKCNAGLRCRFGADHVTGGGRNKIDTEKVKKMEQFHTVDVPPTIQVELRKRTYDFKLSEKYLKHYDKWRQSEEKEQLNGTITDEDIIKVLNREKKTIDWRDKLFLSPLTTVGNLPFRRICVEFGVDVTCGEMAMCSSLLKGRAQEWALTKRHHTEKIFGVQLCANNSFLFTKCGQMLEREMNIDFVDINLGCPIDMVYQMGCGSGLLRRINVLEHCVRNLNQILTVPLTVKTRMGIYTNKNIAHNLMPKYREWGVSLVTVHGRSREQRYTRTANWEYIRECAQAAETMPVLGNGDVLSYEDYKTARENAPELAGIMIGRGALIKPWIYTEIREQKMWDISSSERFDMLKRYTNYGLEHWGSDTKGVENTRRFLLEWLSFLYRYVPVGLLEQPPQKINERPPYYIGRDDMETLMASPAATDWVNITEMLLGPVPDEFKFLPKHKANSYKTKP